jgi:exodeoxyribonuclease VII large subunit
VYPGEVLAVSELVLALSRLLEGSFTTLRVSGEISNLSLASSGHVYFSLKDFAAQIRCVMFRGRALLLDFRPRDGDQVEVLAQVSMYTPRGEVQLQVEQMRAAGKGDLQQQFLELRSRLQQEGLFDATRKRPLPAHPQCIGLITSPQAAALHDVVVTLGRRMPSIPVIVYPCMVQGATAPASLVAAIETANRRAECEVLLLVRGGGSFEDLWAFNDEALARCIVGSRIPIISGVGHESDVTIADFAADRRAATPTAAAAEAAPDRAQVLRGLNASADRLCRAWAASFARSEQRIDLSARLLRPPSALARERQLRLEALAARLSPPRLDRLQQGLLRSSDALLRSIRVRLTTEARSLAARTAQLELLDPQQVIRRGYAILRDGSGVLIRAPEQLHGGQELDVSLAQGEARIRLASAQELL